MSRDQGGTSVVELTVAMFVLGVVGVVIASLLAVAQRTEATTGRDSQSLAELRTATSRLVLEMRQARTIYAGSTARRVRFWVDVDRDNQQDLAERITWEIVSSGNTAELVRTTDASGPSQTHATGLVPADAFQYSPAAPNTTYVVVTLSVDIAPNLAPSERTHRTTVRLRNAAG